MATISHQTKAKPLVTVLLLICTLCDGVCSKLSIHPQLLSRQGSGNREKLVFRVRENSDESNEFEAPIQRTIVNRVRRSLGSASGQPNASKFAFNDSHYVAEVHWAGSNSSTILVLMKNPDSMLTENTPSYFYTSYDYGITFNNITDQFQISASNSTSNITAVLTNFYGSKTNNKVYIVVAKFHRYIFLSEDGCKTFRAVKTDFYPTEIKFHPKYYYYVLAHEGSQGSAKRLYVSTNGGGRWRYKSSNILSYYWDFSATRYTTYLYYLRRTSYSRVGQLYKARANSYTTTHHHHPWYWKWLIGDHHDTRHYNPPVHVLYNVEEFSLIDNYMFATRNVTNETTSLLVSYNRGLFRTALFPGNRTNTAFVIADATENETMVAVAHGESTANLYISDTAGQRFSLSLSRILFYARRKENKYDLNHNFVDLHRVAGLSGIYIATQLTPGTVGNRHLKSVISFDKGGVWQNLSPPDKDKNGNSFNCTSKYDCTLHLSQAYAHEYQQRHQNIYSKESAPGFIIATGSVGKSLQQSVDVYFSRDAGVTWTQVLHGHHFYAFADHGGVIVAVDQFGIVDSLMYSYDEGMTWYTFKFLPEKESKMRIYGLLTEPGEKTTQFTLFGSKTSHHSWEIVQVDMKQMLGRPCNENDYKRWEVADPRNDTERCLLGKVQAFERRDPLVKCLNGYDYTRVNTSSNCECTREDFECDFGFEEVWGGWFSRVCIKDNSTYGNATGIPRYCPKGSIYNISQGYRKVPGDTCVGGVEEQYAYRTNICPVPPVKNFLFYAQRTSMRRIDLDKVYEQVTFSIPGVYNVISLDVDYKNMILFFADITADKIMVMDMKNGSITELLSFNGSSANVESVAYDWTSDNLLWLDAGNVEIGVINVTGGHRKVLVKATLEKPRSLVLHPKAGYMFWSDWGSNAGIYRADMDGMNMQAIINSGLEWPNGVALDLPQNRLYWVDAKFDKIESSNLDGSDRKVLLQYLPHPYAITIFNDLIYWDDWADKRIYKANKADGSNKQTVRGYVYNPMALKAYSSEKQKDVSPCSSNPCAYICSSKRSNSYNCSCPDNMVEQRVGNKVTCSCGEGEELIQGECKAKSGKSCSASQFTCSNRNCIPKTWLCDHDNDCGDSSDEVDCNHPTCDVGKFQCANGLCISGKWKCDGDNDCGDRTDEMNCNKTCPENKFQCKTGQCILKSWMCDGDNDCTDWSDEQNCSARSTTEKPATTCSSSEYQCVSGRCIPSSWSCDGYNDCGDNSDERNCHKNVTCPKATDFKCRLSSKCVPSSYRCDKDNDCGDEPADCEFGSGQCKPTDEVCCSMQQFYCGSGECLNRTQVCDHKRDCSDNSDESGCLFPTNTTIKCDEGEFMCADGSKCIHDKKRCNGYQDCTDGSDEPSWCTTTQRPTTEAPKGCGKDQFRCSYFFHQCIAITKKCDGTMDCWDGTDEFDCAPATTTAPKTTAKIATTAYPCGHDMFRCLYTDECISMAKYCDSNNDCKDGTDEQDCATESPSEVCKDWPLGFQCPDGECVESGKYCDRKLDCLDSSDEPKDVCKVTDHVRKITANKEYDDKVEILWKPPQSIMFGDFQGLQVHYRKKGTKNFTVKDVAKTKSSTILDGAHPCSKYEVAVGVKYVNSANGAVKVDDEYKKKYWLFSSKVIQVRESLTPKPPSQPDPVEGSTLIEWNESSGQCYPRIVSRSLLCSDKQKVKLSYVEDDVETGKKKTEPPNTYFHWMKQYNCTLLIEYNEDDMTSGMPLTARPQTVFASEPFVWTVGGKAHHQKTHQHQQKKKPNRLVWAVPVALVLFALLIGVLIMVVKYRRLQNSFLAFAARGTYTRHQDDDDDDDLSMAVEFRTGDEEGERLINRFSDDDPLVVG